MSESSAHICDAVMPLAMTSLLTKLSVVPGRNFVGQMMADCEGVECGLEAMRVGIRVGTAGGGGTVIQD